MTLRFHPGLTASDWDSARYMNTQHSTHSHRLAHHTGAKDSTAHPHTLVHTSFFVRQYLLHTHWVHGPAQALARDTCVAPEDQSHSVTDITGRQEVAQQEGRGGSLAAVGGGGTHLAGSLSVHLAEQRQWWRLPRAQPPSHSTAPSLGSRNLP